MKRNSSIIASAAVFGAVLCFGAAMAQTSAPAAPASPPAATATTPKAPKVVPFGESDAKAVLNARIAALKTVLELTPDQEKLWPALEAAIRDIARDSARRRKERGTAPMPETFLDILGRMADGEEKRAHDLQKFVAAAKPFVASLSDAQVQRMPAFLGMMETGRADQPSNQLWIFEQEE